MPRTLVLFDVDGTLTVPRQVSRGNKEHDIDPTGQLTQKTSRLHSFQSVKTNKCIEKVSVGIVGGSDLSKIKEQLGDNVLSISDYTFAENGLMAFKGTELLAVQSLKNHLGEERLKRFINFVLRYIADLDIPIKRGTFIEFRNGMLNVSPIGRNCSQQERCDFEEFDKQRHVRAAMVTALKAEFADLGLGYSIGGQISFDVFPVGWDKTYCLNFVKDDFDDIHFFGDKTYEGGNDYEIFMSDRTIGHKTTGPDDTISQCKALFMS